LTVYPGKLHSRSDGDEISYPISVWLLFGGQAVRAGRWYWPNLTIGLLWAKAEISAVYAQPDGAAPGLRQRQVGRIVVHVPQSADEAGIIATLSGPTMFNVLIPH